MIVFFNYLKSYKKFCSLARLILFSYLYFSTSAINLFKSTANIFKRLALNLSNSPWSNLKLSS